MNGHPPQSQNEPMPPIGAHPSDPIPGHKPTLKDAQIDRLWWVAPLVTFGALVPVAVVDLAVLGVAAMATDGCNTGTPCKPAEQISQIYQFAFFAAIIGLVTTLVLPWRALRYLRWTVGLVTVLCAAWPILWIMSGMSGL